MEKIEFLQIVKNNKALFEMAGELWLPFIKQLNEHKGVFQNDEMMSRLERFTVDHSGSPLPKVKEAGIPKCLTLGRMSEHYFANENKFNFYLCTGKTEYIFSIESEDTNIYCNASYIILFNLGLFSGR